MSTVTTTERIQRLNSVSEKRVVNPDTDLIGSLRDGQILPDELLSIAGLDLDLSAEQRATLSREEVASLFDNGIRFEAILEAGFALEIAAAATPSTSAAGISATMPATF